MVRCLNCPKVIKRHQGVHCWVEWQLCVDCAVQEHPEYYAKFPASWKYTKKALAIISHRERQSGQKTSEILLSNLGKTIKK